jgi:hypothetical protein
MQDGLSNEFSPAYSDDTSAFDKALSNRPTSLNQDPKRLELNGKYYQLDNNSKEAKYLYKTIVTALQTDWFRRQGKKSKKAYVDALKAFLPWLRKYTFGMENLYLTLKDYESYRVNECSIKPQSSGVSLIIILLKNGVESIYENEIVKYIKKLVRNTKVSMAEERQQDTLTGYFGAMPWLREVIGERDYLKLESPKLLMKSFSVVVATTLLFIIEQKKIAKKKLADPSKLIKVNVVQKRSRNNSYCRDLILDVGEFYGNCNPLNELTELMLLDFVPEDRRGELIGMIKKSNGTKKIGMKTSDGSRKYLFTNPCIFHYENWDVHSEIEQYLCAWLCAWQAIQPTDIGKLKKNNFVINRNEHGKAISIQCVYYKSRSQRVHEPPMLSATQIEGKALIAYLEELTENNSILFSNDILRIPNLNFSPCTMPGRISRLFQSEAIRNKVNSNLQYAQASAVFIKGYVAIALQQKESYHVWLNRQRAKNNPGSIEIYRKLAKKPMPMQNFGLCALKNSSIHARTDKYRDGDLVNLNSHTSLTEKLSYLTDSNKEWINQNGRVTRLVLKDIENYVYKPKLMVVEEIAYEAIVRTHVINALSDGISDKNAVVINSIGRVDRKKTAVELPDTDFNDILVLDSKETVVTMLHYIKEAERQYANLISNALKFFEETVLPNVEWMEYLLRNCKLSPEVIKAGNDEYEKIKEFLPKLFENELRGGVGI